jgi:hypothetical protein
MKNLQKTKKAAKPGSAQTGRCSLEKKGGLSFYSAGNIPHQKGLEGASSKPF